MKIICSITIQERRRWTKKCWLYSWLSANSFDIHCFSLLFNIFTIQHLIPKLSTKDIQLTTSVNDYLLDCILGMMLQSIWYLFHFIHFFVRCFFLHWPTFHTLYYLIKKITPNDENFHILSLGSREKKEVHQNILIFQPSFSRSLEWIFLSLLSFHAMFFNFNLQTLVRSKSWNWLDIKNQISIK